MQNEDSKITQEFGIAKGSKVKYVRYGRPEVTGVVKGFRSGMVYMDTSETKTGHFQAWPQNLQVQQEST